MTMVANGKRRLEGGLVCRVLSLFNVHVGEPRLDVPQHFCAGGQHRWSIGGFICHQHISAVGTVGDGDNRQAGRQVSGADSKLVPRVSQPVPTKRSNKERRRFAIHRVDRCLLCPI